MLTKEGVALAGHLLLLVLWNRYMQLLIQLSPYQVTRCNIYLSVTILTMDVKEVGWLILICGQLTMELLPLKIIHTPTKRLNLVNVLKQKQKLGFSTKIQMKLTTLQMSF